MMKKILRLLFVFLLPAANIFAQTILSENFNSYDGTLTSVPANWILSYTGSGSYYSTPSNSGLSGPNSYKFGEDSATAITPQFAGADSVHFWIKGNGTDMSSALSIYYTIDQLSYVLLDSIDSLPTTGTVFHFSLPAGTARLKFIYSKSLGNIAFDDFMVTATASGIINMGKTAKPFTVFPMPATGPVQINFSEPVKEAKFSIYNMIGREIKNIPVERITNQKFNLNFGEQQPGYYFIRIQTEKFNYTTRITIAALLTGKINEGTA